MTRLRRWISRRRLTRWLSGKIPPAAMLGLKDEVRHELAWEAYRLLTAECPEEASRLYALILQLWPSDQTALLGQGACALSTGDLQTAIITFGSVLDRDPDNLYALANCAECRMLSGDLSQAGSLLDHAVALLQRPDSRVEPALRTRVEKLREAAGSTPSSE